MKIGQYLNDKFGNEYTVTRFDEDGTFEVMCIKFVKEVCLGTPYNTITRQYGNAWVSKECFDLFI